MEHKQLSNDNLIRMKFCLLEQENEWTQTKENNRHFIWTEKRKTTASKRFFSSFLLLLVPWNLYLSFFSETKRKDNCFILLSSTGFCFAATPSPQTWDWLPDMRLFPRCLQLYIFLRTDAILPVAKQGHRPGKPRDWRRHHKWFLQQIFTCIFCVK